MKKIVALLLVLGLAAFNAVADVNINTATQEQLETLKGVGPAKAKAIIDYRTKNGPFKSLAEIEKVRGIGPGLFKNIKSDIKLSGETVVKAHDKGQHKGADKKAEPAEPAKPAAKPAAPAAKADAKSDSKGSDKGAKK
jgi:competence protein ComEA